MLTVLGQSWSLLFGMLLLMLGNGIQGTLLGIRGAIEGYSTLTMAVVMSGYFVGFLGGSIVAPTLIGRVGHVRVFAALASLISASLILFAAFPLPAVWLVLRILIGFCFSGVYVVAESWLNDRATNETRGKTLSLYLIVQLVGVVTAQGFMNLGDPGGYFLFVVASVLVSISFTPVLLSVTPVPAFQSAKRMSLLRLWRHTPLVCICSFLLGGIFGVLWGMSAVFGTLSDLSVREISIFVAAIYTGGLVCQYPIGWLSDKVDRRLLIFVTAALCAAASIAGLVVVDSLVPLLVTGFLIGGMANPLYSLVIAHMNDALEPEDMASASGRLMFIHGVGAISGPLVGGGAMDLLGPHGYFAFLFVLAAIMAAFAGYRKRINPPAEGTGAYTDLHPTSTPVAMTMAVEEILSEDEPEEEA